MGRSRPVLRSSNKVVPVLGAISTTEAKLVAKMPGCRQPKAARSSMSLSKLAHAFVARRIDHKQIGECAKIEQPLDLRGETAECKLAIRFVSQFAGQKKRTKSGAADIGNVLEIH